MAQVELGLPGISQSILDRRVTRRSFVRGAQVGAIALANVGVIAATQNFDFLVNDIIHGSISNSEFFKEAVPVPQDELDKLLSEHTEEQLPFSSVEGEVGSLFKGEFLGNGSPLYLRLPGIQRETPQLAVLDILADNRYIRTGIICSPDPKPKTIILGPMSGGDGLQSNHRIRIFDTDSGEGIPISPDEIVPELWHPTNFSLRTLIDRVSPFTVPHEGYLPWDDCLVEKTVMVLRHGENYRLWGRKIDTAENSRYKSLMDEKGRTYDDDWETKTEVTPEGHINFVDIQRYNHRTKDYNSDYFAYGTHPVVEVYTENGMVRPTSDFHDSLPHNADQQRVISYSEWSLRSKLHIVDADLQAVSFDELRREGRNPKTIKKLTDVFETRQVQVPSESSR